jgi:hypothetical protein
VLVAIVIDANGALPPDDHCCEYHKGVHSHSQLGRICGPSLLRWNLGTFSQKKLLNTAHLIECKLLHSSMFGRLPRS